MVRVGTSSASRQTELLMEPLQNVVIEGSMFRSTSDQYWLRASFGGLAIRGRWVELVYESSFFDDLARPAVRLVMEDGNLDLNMPGAVLGRGVWTGYIPSQTREVLIRPTAQAGPFGFRLVECRTLSRIELLRRMVRGSWTRTAAALLASVRGMSMDAISHVGFAICQTPFEQYDRWRGQRTRPIEVNGIDGPRSDWRTTPHIRVLVKIPLGGEKALTDLIATLEVQPYPNWSVAAICEAPGQNHTYIRESINLGRVLVLGPDASNRDLSTGLHASALIGRCAPGDEFPENALAMLGEHASKRPLVDVIYADNDWTDQSGHVDPEFKPDWSPVFQSHSNYIGAPAFVRAELLAGSPRWRDFADPSTSVDHVVDLQVHSVSHLRRIVLTRRKSTRPIANKMGSDERRPRRISARGMMASVIVPTRDRLSLLKTCLESVVSKAADARHEIIIVDNGSTRSSTLAYFAKVTNDDRIRVLHRPGAFNFSALCNDGASIARGDTLVFLNNDTEVVSADWIDPLMAWTSREGIGAVGAKLVFPSGRLQHAGVVVGLGGRADHPGVGIAGDDPSYLGRANTIHEVSAVTGACLAIAKKTFDELGGFNAVDLPIELNDIDLCLRLRERGLKNIYVPDSVLIHFESASRGMISHASKKYARERAYFIDRWSAVIRDDPYFHPALSLSPVKIALG